MSGRFSKPVGVLALLTALTSSPVSSFAADVGGDPYDASYAQGHFLNPPPVYDPPSYSHQQVSNSPAPVVTSVSAQESHVSVPAAYNPSSAAPSPTYTSYATASSVPHSPALSLGSRNGFELGVQGSYYRYQEHVTANSEFMHETGPKVGITFSGTKVFTSNFFFTGDLRLAYGQNNYSSAGSGTKDGNPDYLGEVRVLGGKDFTVMPNQVALSPYLGLGYRNLLNDLRGKTSTGASGYRRDSQYLYLPVGMTSRLAVRDNARLALNLEYDQLIRGWQKSYLSDASSSLSDVDNTQTGGRGFRGSLMYELTHWSAGPFFDYWNIDRSDSGTYGAYEPHNQTIEYGLQAKYRF